jgi:HSP20 family protein
MRSLIPWRRRDPETSVDRSFMDFRREFDDLVQTFFSEHGTAPERYFGLRFTAAFDVSETDNEIIVRAELPGVDAKDVEVTLAGNLLTVKGEKR